MIIKYNKKDTYLISPEEIKTFLGINTEKYIVMDKNTFGFKIEHLNEFISSENWIEEEIDGRKLRKAKKNIITEFGNSLLNEYKTTNKIYETLSKKFINTSGVSEVFKNALSNNMNLILFGKGGFGKSEMCDLLFSGVELKDRVFVKSLSEATTEDDLFGGVNIKKLTDTGILEYNCENSFANKEIVIFEEIFDANPRVLAALKDTLTSKEIRNGNQRFPIKTKIIIGLTNKTYEDVIEDDSTEALTQRFPISYKLQYKLDKLNTASLILNRYSDFSDKKLSAMIETIGEMNDLTPRKVLEMAKYIKDLDIKSNRNYNEKITNNLMSPVINYLKNARNIDLSKLIFNEVVIAKKSIREEDITDYDSFIDMANNINIIKNINNNPGDYQNSLNLEIEELIKLINKKIE